MQVAHGVRPPPSAQETSATGAAGCQAAFEPKDYVGVSAMIADGLWERATTVRLDDYYVADDDLDELDKDLRALVNQRRAC